MLMDSDEKKMHRDIRRCGFALVVVLVFVVLLNLASRQDSSPRHAPLLNKKASNDVRIFFSMETVPTSIEKLEDLKRQYAYPSDFLDPGFNERREKLGLTRPSMREFDGVAETQEHAEAMLFPTRNESVDGKKSVDPAVLYIHKHVPNVAQQVLHVSFDSTWGNEEGYSPVSNRFSMRNNETQVLVVNALPLIYGDSFGTRRLTFHAQFDGFADGSAFLFLSARQDEVSVDGNPTLDRTTTSRYGFVVPPGESIFLCSDGIIETSLEQN